MSTISEQEYKQRISQLEKLNATLAAQVDRQAKVVDAVLPWKHTLRLTPAADAIEEYEREMKQVTKGDKL